jgi:hypoxanthine phosphoribosyltransferase
MEDEIWLAGQEPELRADIQQVFLTSKEIQQRVKELAKQLSEDYRGKNPVLVGALKGVVCFMADLMRNMTIPVEMDFIAVSSYSKEARDQGLVRIVKDLDRPITGRHVIFVEDVIDTGLTLNYLTSNLRVQQPASLEVCVLFDKTARRLIDFPLKYKGFNLPDYFVVGYGLDYQERYRNLPFVGILKSSVFLNRSNR